MAEARLEKVLVAASSGCPGEARTSSTIGGAVPTPRTLRDRFSLRQRFCCYLRSTIPSTRLNHPHHLLRQSIRFPLMPTSWFTRLQFRLYQPGDRPIADTLLSRNSG